MSGTAALSLPNIEQYQNLIPIARELYEHTLSIAQKMLLPLFLVSIAIGYTADLGISGAVVAKLKRLVVTALLLVAFPYIASFVQTIGIEIAISIDDMSGIDKIMAAAGTKAGYLGSTTDGLLTFANDMLLSFLVACSYVILAVARYLLLAFQHFYWLTITALAPLLILTNLFEATSGIVKGMFKNLIQVACWPIIWAILSAYLKALPFADAYNADAGYNTLIVMNLILAIALLFSPFLVSQFCEGVSLSMGDTIRRGVMNTVALANPKTAALKVASAKSFAKDLNDYRKNFSSKKPPGLPNKTPSLKRSNPKE